MYNKTLRLLKRAAYWVEPTDNFRACQVPEVEGFHQRAVLTDELPGNIL